MANWWIIIPVLISFPFWVRAFSYKPPLVFAPDTIFEPLLRYCWAIFVAFVSVGTWGLFN